MVVIGAVRMRIGVVQAASVQVPRPVVVPRNGLKRRLDHIGNMVLLCLLSLKVRASFHETFLLAVLNTSNGLNFQAVNGQTVSLSQGLVVRELTMIFVNFALSIAHHHLHRVNEKLLRLLMLIRIFRSLFRQQKAL